GQRTKRYAREDLERLKKRHDARSGHAAVAAGAPRWGEPRLESSITEICGGGAGFRGHAAADLATHGRSLENAAGRLWCGALPERRSIFPPGRRLAPVSIPAGTPGLDAMLAIVPASAMHDPARFQQNVEAELPRARSLIRTLAATVAVALDRARV